MSLFMAQKLFKHFSGNVFLCLSSGMLISTATKSKLTSGIITSPLVGFS
jgi:hypothetical protein